MVVCTTSTVVIVLSCSPVVAGSVVDGPVVDGVVVLVVVGSSLQRINSLYQL